ncbi:hypothetical protein, partial [Pseudomonas aeruginosa]|uniref:hypothetical protein n=1 Tax=Pseudomonas aeruginosa TaxID=287 RepID=UPI001CC1E014
SQETGYDKSHPEAFQYVLGKLGTDRKLTVVYEDADYAIAGAKLASLQTVTPSYIKEFYK